MKRLRAYRPDLLAAALFLLLPLLLYGSVTLGSRTMVPADNLFQWQPWASAADELGVTHPQNALLSDMILENYVWRQFIQQSINQGEIPLWNPYTFAGMPFLATGQHSAYYPFSFFFLILPLAKAYGWYTISQLWLAGLFAYFFARILKMRRPGAAVAGLVFQGGGFFVVSSAVFPMILGAAVWLPLLLAAIEKVIQNAASLRGAGNTLPWAAFGAIALGCQILAGHIEITYYTLLVMAFFALWRLLARLFNHRREVRDHNESWTTALLKPGMWLLAFVLVGLLLGGIQLIPFVEAGQANFREGSATLDQIRGWAFPPRRVLTLAMPDFFGNPSDHDYFDILSWQSKPFTLNYFGEPNPRGATTSDWGIKNYVEGGIYLGILPLILALLGICAAWRVFPSRRPVVAFFTTLGLLSLAFIFGTPLYAVLYYGLPGINQLHSPFRWVFPLTLCVAMLAGFGMDYLAGAGNRITTGEERCKANVGSRLARLIRLGAGHSLASWLGGMVFWSGLSLVGGLLLLRAYYASLEPTLERVFLGLAQAADAFPGTRAFISYEAEQLFILAVMLILSGLVLRVASTSLRIRGLPLWQLAAPLIVLLDLALAGYGFRTAADPALLAYKPEIVTWLQQQEGIWRLTTFAPHGDKPLNANTPWLYGLQDIRGYDSIILKQYTGYMGAIEPQNELLVNRVQPIVNWESLNSPLLDLLGVRHIVSSEEIDLPRFKEVWRGEGLIVFENAAAVPRAYTISQGATILVDDALEAMRARDPRQYVFVETADWPGGRAAAAQASRVVPATIASYGSIEVKVQAEVSEPSWLVLNDTYFSGWDAYISPIDAVGQNGDEVKGNLFRVNGNFRGVRLDSGHWEVRFRYSPLSFKLGGLASFMGGTILLFALLVWGWRRFYKPQGPLTNTRSIAKNSLAPMTLNLFNRAIDFVFAAFYLRVLGPADAGKYATAIIIAGWFEIISNWGLNTLIIREVSQDKNKASRYLINSSVLRIGTSLLAAGPVLVYITGVSLAGNPLGNDTSTAILLLMAGMLFSGVSQGFAGLFYAFEVAEVNAAITTVTTILKVLFGVLALLLGYGFVGLAAVSIVVNVITLALLAVAAFRQFPLAGPYTFDRRLQQQMFKVSYPLMLNHLLAVIFFQIDVPLMRQINGEKAVGWYNSAYKWIYAFNVIPSFFTFALFPVISRQAKQAIQDARRTFRLAIKLMVLISLPLATLTTLLAPLLIRILGGAEFLPDGAIALQLLVWSIPVGWMNSVVNYVLIALGLERKLTGVFVVGVTFNLIANLIFLPRYSYVSASVITILSEMLLLALFAFYLRAKMPDVGWTRIVRRPLLLTAAMVAAVVLGSQINLAIGFFLGLLVYLPGLWLFRVVGEDELEVLRAVLPARLARRFRPAADQDLI